MSKKRTTTVLSILSIILLIVMFIWNPCTASNRTMEYRNDRNVECEIQFSKQSGFYSEDFLLEIYAPTDEIYYTLDGSDPDETAIPYTQPIPISDATPNENVYSARTDTSTAFFKELLWKTNSSTLCDPAYEYQVPDYAVDKCTVVRAVYYDKNRKKSDITTGVYFVGYEDRAGYEGIDIICITTDPDNLFGYENGIYVTGKTFDDLVDNGYLEEESDYLARGLSNFWDANYHLRGSAAERSATMQLINPHGNIYTQNVGVRIQGGASRSTATKSLNLYARKKYGNNTKIFYDFWSTGYIPDKVTLSSCGNDMYSKIRDRLVAKLSIEAEAEFATMHFRPYILFLNGEYWGIYYIVEKYDEEYLGKYYNVDSNNVAMIKAGSLEFGEEEDLLMYQKMMCFLESEDLSDADNYEIASNLIDIQSTIDYFAVELYVGRCNDWYPGYGNTALWKVQQAGEGDYEDGKWRWMLFDQNSGGLGFISDGIDSIENTRAISPMFNNLCTNESFRAALAERIIELGQGAFSTSNVNAAIDKYVEELEEPMNVYFKRFFGTDTTKFYSEVASIQAFFEHRLEDMIGYIEKNFQGVDIELLY